MDFNVASYFILLFWRKDVIFATEWEDQQILDKYAVKNHGIFPSSLYVITSYKRLSFACNKNSVTNN